MLRTLQVNRLRKKKKKLLDRKQVSHFTIPVCLIDLKIMSSINHDPSLDLFFFFSAVNNYPELCWGDQNISFQEKNICPFSGPVLINQICADLLHLLPESTILM